MRLGFCFAHSRDLFEEIETGDGVFQLPIIIRVFQTQQAINHHVSLCSFVRWVFCKCDRASSSALCMAGGARMQASSSEPCDSLLFLLFCCVCGSAKRMPGVVFGGCAGVAVSANTYQNSKSEVPPSRLALSLPLFVVFIPEKVSSTSWSQFPAFLDQA
jgi:hypothetical protein